MIKLIATDMDGTFLDSQKTFDKSFFDLFYQLKEKNIKFVIASGNQYYRLYQKFLPLSEQMYFIAENGSYIADGTTELYCNTIQNKDIDVIKKFLLEIPRLIMVLCGRKGAYILKNHYFLRNEIKKYYCAYTFVDSFEEVEDEFMKISLYDTQHHNNEILNSIQNQLPQSVKVVTSGNEWMDIQNKNINKGIAIKYLQSIYDIYPDECMAFGDQMNDYEMLQEVKYAYAMSNAVKPIQEVAYEVIGSNDEQSVICKIKEILNKE
ncbi:Cof-type HAD-IIB family hydrolase [Candidatus Stoquefichus massiliensis]|uniref:Cof-type HAD-IIB family hydrolase n=1 Tax=Candidatus Stoquefichus massiliensis TaxID=1470350 RepID=UPI000480EE06|nr:HAD family hydrolase [Candidatus Stoquefichus massiliensis]